MDTLIIRLPTDAEAERSRRFTVHRHYLQSMELFLLTLYDGAAMPRKLIEAQRNLPAVRRINRRRTANEPELRRLLAIAWASELQLRLAEFGGEAFLRYSNAWAPVQAYYAIYMSIHATLGMGGLVDDHTRTLRTAVSHVVTRGLLPHPWEIRCEGCPELKERRIIGVPTGIDADAPFENLALPALTDFYPRLAKMLETTRNQRLQRIRKEWLHQQGRQRMPADEKRSAAARLHATTLFDYFWRLRIRANYGDVSAFLMSGVDDRDHSSFHRGLVTLTSATCLLLQGLVVAYTGKRPYCAALDEFLDGGGVDLGQPAEFLRERRDVLGS